MKKIIALVSFLLMISCSKKKDEPTGPSQLSKEQALSMIATQTITDMDDYVRINAWRGGYFVFKEHPSLEPYKKQINKVLEITSGCGDPPIQGDQTDNDGDEIPLNAWFDLNCDTTINFGDGTQRIVYQGRVRGEDPNDNPNDPNSKWIGKVTVNNPSRQDQLFKMRFEINNQQQNFFIEWLFRYTISTNRQGNNYSVLLNENISLIFPDSLGNPQSFGPLNINYNIVFTSNDPNWYPDSSYLSGSLSLTGNFQYQNETWAINTPQPLQYSKQCVIDNEPMPLGGTLRYQYQQEEIRAVFTSCGQCTIYYNNQVIGSCETGPVY
ncbi:MAG: hypothetical protein N2504_01525 [candidate division WOR-3 bacterium]|nr:hypothetical protein [candidate division WOR-3 bacterium]MCX7947250.1 hypothetical protein [candidate division WOR-3 bacterium]MDW8150193.1 hypothetical protein [candidate division WOR-3 bacterium]